METPSWRIPSALLQEQALVQPGKQTGGSGACRCVFPRSARPPLGGEPQGPNSTAVRPPLRCSEPHSLPERESDCPYLQGVTLRLRKISFVKTSAGHLRRKCSKTSAALGRPGGVSSLRHGVARAVHPADAVSAISAPSQQCTFAQRHGPRASTSGYAEQARAERLPDSASSFALG